MHRIHIFQWIWSYTFVFCNLSILNGKNLTAQVVCRIVNVNMLLGDSLVTRSCSRTSSTVESCQSSKFASFTACLQWNFSWFLFFEGWGWSKRTWHFSICATFFIANTLTANPIKFLFFFSIEIIICCKHFECTYSNYNIYT